MGTTSRSSLVWQVIISVILFAVLQVTARGYTPKYPSKGLFPTTFNLAANAGITVNATCGETAPETYCKLVEHIYDREPQCSVCDGSSPSKQHPISYAIDGSNRWWQSPSLQNGKQYEWVTITLDLKQVFQVAYVIVKCGISPRPGNWILERSLDGVFYRPWQYYAVSDDECWEAYGVAPTPGKPAYKTDDQVICTSYYSSVTPLEDGEIHTSLVNGRPGAVEFTEKLMDFTKARYIRLRLQRIRTLNADLMTFQTNDPDKVDKSVTRRYFYTIRDISIGGQCVCSGHAKECPAQRNGDLHCKCEHNTCGTSCERCCPLYNQQPWRMGTGEDAAECEACECFGHASSCVYDPAVAKRKASLNTQGVYEGGGVCQNCTHHTSGVNCERCEDGYYRPHNVRPDSLEPCQKCSCSGPGATRKCVSDDTHINEGLFPGDCICHEGFAGPKCDSCARGYRNYPRCERCRCHYAGTEDSTQCDGHCVCKKHVEGDRCDQCSHGFYDLSESNPEGCSSCYCFGITNICRPSDWGVEYVTDPEGWVITDIPRRKEVQPTPERGQLTIADDDVGMDMYYWEAPEKFLGNKLYSYGGDIKVMLNYVAARGDTSGHFVDGPVVILEGNGLRVGYTPGKGQKPSRGNVTVSAPLREQEWQILDDRGRPLGTPTRQEFTLLLHNMDRFLLRAKYHTDQVEGAMSDIALPVASRESKSVKKMTSVEMCQCPPGYGGLSCELCAPGYRRVNDTLVGGRCESCDCNNHAESCDASLGRCYNCLHFTTGEKCHKCLPGYYGNPLLGFPDDCKPCACPLADDDRFSPACRSVLTTSGESDYVCTECPPNHSGNKCERCADGYYGNPTTPGEECRPCRCGPNTDTSIAGYCDHRTGRCLRCRGNTGGWHCLDCLDGFYGNPTVEECRTCDCSVVGSTSQQCNRTTGQCTCKPGFSGRACDRCHDGFGNVESGCVPCLCDPRGSVSSRCDPITGACHCRPGVFGTHCDSCLEAHYGFSYEGCRYCGCDPHGSLAPQCDERTGQCRCHPSVVGRQCDRCQGGYWNIQSGRGCEECRCHATGSLSNQCDERTGQCPCKPGVGGKECDRCLPGHYKFGRHGCNACEPCDTPGRVCDEETGRCICPRNTGGPRCNRCNSGAWGFDPVEGCKLCECNHLGSLGPNCDDATGQCRCQEGFEGQHCDRCRHGYYGFPTCKRCDCHMDGTQPDSCNAQGVCQCDKRGQCPCKENVHGRRCEQCKEGTFSLVATNPKGCTECFMFGRTKKCQQARAIWADIVTPPQEVTTDVGQPELRQVYHYKVIPPPKAQGPSRVGIPYLIDQPLYWSLPDEFLGDKIASYNGRLRFRVESESDSKFPDTLMQQYPLVFLQGNTRILLRHNPKEVSPTGHYTVRIHEDDWERVDNPHVPVTREMLMVALQNVQHILIRATDGPDVRYARLSEVSLENAVPLRPGEVTPYVAQGVETGRCPYQYTGLSCQDPADGFYRKRKPNYLDSKILLDLVGWAEPCDCNNRTRTCDKETGACIGCTGNTVGDHCERCAQGYYGIPARGPCLPCACPLPTNSFSDTCQTSGPDYVCTDCQPGYTGRRCERCADGYFGNPLVEGGRCESCECNPYGSHSRRCDSQTGQCHCLPGITGRDCTMCMARHILTEYGCKSCNDACTGILLDDVEAMLERLNGIDPDDLLSSLWLLLFAMNDTTSALRVRLDRYLYLIEEGNQVLSNFSFHFNLETQANILLERAIDTAITTPKVADDAHQVLLDAQRLLDEINNIWKDILDLVDRLKRHGIGQGEIGLGIARMIEEAKRILQELQRRKFDRPFEDAQRENRKAHNLLDRVKGLLLNPQHAGGITERLDRVEALLREILVIVQEDVQKPTANALNLVQEHIQKLEMVHGLMEDSVHLADSANSSLHEARELLQNARDDVIDASLNFDELPRLLKELRNMTEALEHRRGTLDRINPEYREKYVRAAERHAAMLEAQVDRLADQFKQTQEVSEAALKAAKVYENIEDAIKEAEEAARGASEAADRAYKEAYPRYGETLMSRAERARDRSEDLLRQAKELRDHSVPELQYDMRAKKAALRALEKDITYAQKALAAINRELDKLRRDVAAGAREARRKAEAADDTQRDANDKIDDLLARIALLGEKAAALETGSAQGLDNLTKLIDDAQRGVRVADKLAERSEQSVGRASRQHSQLQLNLKELRDKILLARQRASSIRVSLSADDDGVCSRSFRPEIESTTTNTIVLNFAIKEPDANSLLFFIANSDGKDDFMAIEMIDRKIKFSFNAGGGTTSLKHNMQIETNDHQLGKDSQWYKVEVFRVGNFATLSVKRKPDGARDDPEEVSGASPPGYGRMDLDSTSHFYVGRVPEDIPAARELTATNFVGCLHEVILDGKQVGLWNFLTNEGCDGCKTGPTEDVDPGSYHFKGEGYAIQPQIRRYNKEYFFLSMLIKTFDEEALLFLCPNLKTGDFLSVGLRGGHVVFQFKMGSNAPVELRTEKKYNSGNWTRVVVERDRLEGVLNVEDEILPGSLPRTSPDSMDLQKSKLYFGAVPPDFDTSRFSTVVFQNYIGCLKDPQVDTTPLDLLKHEAYRVDPGCSDRKVKLVSFQGSGYVELQSKTLAAEGNFGFTFQTTQSDALLMISTFSGVKGSEHKKDNYYSVALRDGFLDLRLNGGSGAVTLTSKQRYNDGKFHTVAVLKTHRRIHLNVDDEEIAQDRLPKGSSEVEAPSHGGLFFGGVRSGIAIGSQAATREYFMGTIKDAVFNDKLLGFNSPVSFEGAGIGRLLEMHTGRASSHHDQMEVLTEQQLEQCSDAPEYVLEEHAVKFGDALHSHVLLQVPTVDSKGNFTLSLSFRTYYPNGVLVVALNGARTRYFALVLSGGTVVLEVLQKTKKSIHSHGSLNDGQWHTVLVRKEDSYMKVQVDKNPDVDMPGQRKVPFSSSLYVGGIPQRLPIPGGLVVKESFKGCIRNLNLNERPIDLASGESHTIGQCFSSIEKGAFFQGDAYAVYANRFNVNNKLEIELEFKTSQQNGILLSLSEKSRGGSPALAVELYNGEVIVSVDLGHNGTGAFRARKEFASRYKMCDGRWHLLRAHFSRDQIFLRVDKEEAVNGLALATPPEPHTSSPLYVGGLPEDGSNGALFGRDNFVGCLRNVAVNDNRVDWIDMASIHNVLPNSCPAN
ncbi:laminin subunit alpha lam-3-like [Ornithodoros turicata]|uniref:laminin subunit alpha lam-3-like n=1 Tax=Ornithodoros turicata TaxID=34597 RepID=UPI003138930A